MYGQYQTHVTAATDGSFAPFRVDSQRRLVIVTESGGALQTSQSDSFVNYTSGTHTVKTGAGTLSRFIVNDPGSTVTATLYDNTAASGTKIATIPLVAGLNLSFGLAFATGLTVVLSGACDVTITYS